MYLSFRSMSEIAWLQHLPAHDKLRVAVERSRLSDYRNRASGRVRRNRRFDIGIGLHRKRLLHAVDLAQVDPVRPLPRMRTLWPTGPATGAVSTRG